MALIADFTSTTRTGDNVQSIIFSDNSSGGVVTYRKWILGDGTVIENQTLVVHLYRSSGKYDVTLVVGNTVEQASVTKEDWVIVNYVPPTPQMIIIQSFNAVTNAYWKVYIRTDFRMVFEDQNFLFVSNDPVIQIKEWTLLEYHAPTNKFYRGTYGSPRQEISFNVSVNPSPVTPSTNLTEVAPQSTMKIDELKIWATEKDLKSYYYTLRGQAGILDLTT